MMTYNFKISLRNMVIGLFGTVTLSVTMVSAQVWAPRYIYPSYDYTTIPALWTGICDHRVATLCGVQNIVKVVDRAVAKACPAVLGPAATNATRTAMFASIEKGEHNLNHLSNPSDFGLFAIREDSMVMADSLLPKAVGSKIVYKDRYKNKFGNATKSIITNENLMVDILGGNLRFHQRMTNRIYTNGGGVVKCKDFYDSKWILTETCPTATLLYARECPIAGDASGSTHRYFMAAEIGTEVMREYPNNSADNNSYESVQNVRRIIGNYLANSLLTRNRADMERIWFDVNYGSKYYTPQGFYVFSLEYGMDSIDNVYSGGDHVAHGAGEQFVGLNITEYRLSTQIAPEFLEETIALEYQFANAASSGGAWTHYKKRTESGYLMKTALIVGLEVWGVKYSIGVGFNHLPKPFLSNAGCTPCSAAFNTPCSIENTLSLISHVNAYLLIEGIAIKQYWATLNSDPSYTINKQNWNTYTTVSAADGNPNDLRRTDAMAYLNPTMDASGRSDLTYPFIFEYGGRNKANPANLAENNQLFWDSNVVPVDPATGQPVIDAIKLHETFKATADAGGGWVRYKWKLAGEAEAYDKMAYIMKVTKGGIDHYLGVGYADVHFPLDTVKCNSKYADVCSDMNINSLIGSAVSSIFATTNVQELNNVLRTITQATVLPFLLGKTLGYDIDIYDATWACYGKAYSEEGDATLDSLSNKCIQAATQNIRDFILHNSKGGWLKEKVLKNTVKDVPIDADEIKYSDVVFRGATTEEVTATYVKPIQHRFGTVSYTYYLVVILRNASLAPRCDTDNDCYADQVLEDDAKSSVGTLSSDPNNGQLECNPSTKRCECASDKITGQRLFSPVYRPITCGDLPRHSVKCILNEEMLCPIKTPNEALYLSQGLDKYGCAYCPPGEVRETTPTGGVRRCVRAKAGHMAVNSKEIPCPKGTFQSETGSQFCIDCAPGSFADKEGQAVCTPCQPGSYQPLGGAVECKACTGPGGSVYTSQLGAMSKSQCSCLAGFMKNDQSLDTSQHACLSCPKGLDCPEGSAYSNFGLNCPAGTQKLGTEPKGGGEPLKLSEVGKTDSIPMACFQVSRGYWMKEFKLPFETKSCHPLGETAFSHHDYKTPCVGGGNTGDNVCREGHSDIVCGMCKDTWFKGTAGYCEECRGQGNVAFLFLLLSLLILFPVASYFFVNGQNSGKMTNVTTVTAGFGIFIATMQSVAAIAQLNIAWSSGLRSMFALLGVLVLDLRILKSDCILGSDPGNSYIMKILSSYFCIFILFASGHISRRLFLPSQWQYMHRNKVFNTFGTIYQIVFVTVFLAVLSPFRCYKHPDGSESMVDATAILCGEGKHTQLTATAFIAMFTQTIPFMLIYIYMVRVLPSRSLIDANYAESWKFIVYRFHSSAWWYGIILLLRNFLIVLATTMDPAIPFLPTFFLSAILIKFLVLQVLVWPWKTRLLNTIDMMMTSLLLCMLCGAMALVHAGDSNSDSTHLANTLVAVCYMLLVGVFVVFVGYEFSRIVRHTSTPERREAHEEHKDHKLQLQMNRVKIIFEAYHKIPHHKREGLIRSFVGGISEIDIARMNKVLWMMAIDLIPDSNVVTAFQDPLNESGENRQLQFGENQLKTGAALLEQFGENPEKQKSSMGIASLVRTFSGGGQSVRSNPSLFSADHKGGGSTNHLDVGLPTNSVTSGSPGGGIAGVGEDFRQQQMQQAHSSKSGISAGLFSQGSSNPEGGIVVIPPSETTGPPEDDEKDSP